MPQFWPGVVKMAPRQCQTRQSICVPNYAKVYVKLLAVTLHRHPLYAPLQPPHILQQFSPAILIPPLIPSIVNIITIVSSFFYLFQQF